MLGSDIGQIIFLCCVCFYECVIRNPIITYNSSGPIQNVEREKKMGVGGLSEVKFSDPAPGLPSRRATVGLLDADCVRKRLEEIFMKPQIHSGSEHSLPLKGKRLSSRKVTLFGFPCGGWQLTEDSWQEAVLVAPGQAGENSDLLFGPQELLLPWEEEEGREEGKTQGGAVGEFQKKKKK